MSEQHFLSEQPMRERDKTLTTDQKALAINLDKYKFGTIVEIGAG